MIAQRHNGERKERKRHREEPVPAAPVNLAFLLSCVIASAKPQNTYAAAGMTAGKGMKAATPLVVAPVSGLATPTLPITAATMAGGCASWGSATPRTRKIILLGYIAVSPSLPLSLLRSLRENKAHLAGGWPRTTLRFAANERQIGGCGGRVTAVRFTLQHQSRLLRSELLS